MNRIKYEYVKVIADATCNIVSLRNVLLARSQL